MPSHIYSLCCLYHEAIACSWKEVEADRKYVDYAGAHNFYPTARCHDLHMLMYASMMAGRFEPAIWAADGMCATLTRDVLTTGIFILIVFVIGITSWMQTACVVVAIRLSWR